MFSLFFFVSCRFFRQTRKNKICSRLPPSMMGLLRVVAVVVAVFVAIPYGLEHPTVRDSAVMQSLSAAVSPLVDQVEHFLVEKFEQNKIPDWFARMGVGGGGLMSTPHSRFFPPYAVVLHLASCQAACCKGAQSVARVALSVASRSVRERPFWQTFGGI